MLSQVASSDACVSCGACCANYRVSFYWAEAERMPANMVEPLTAVYSCMKGTNQAQVKYRITRRSRTASQLFDLRHSKLNV